MERVEIGEVKDFRKGETKLTQLFELNAKQVAALLMTGHKLYQLGRIKDAKSIFEGLDTLDGSIAYAHGILGAIYQKEEKYDPAVERYDTALKLFPQDINSLTNRGEIHLKLGRFEQAAADLEKAMELDPERSHPAANRARMLVCLVQDALRLAKEKGTEAVEAERRNAKVRASQEGVR